MAVKIFAVFFLIAPILGQMMGGWTPAKPKSIPKEITDFAMQTFNRRSNSISLYKIVEVIHAETQVVAGMNYKLKLRFGPTDCRNSQIDETELAKCNPGKGHVHVCTIVVYSEPWEKITKVTEFKCTAEKEAKHKQTLLRKPLWAKKPRMGGKSKMDESSDESRDVLNFAIEELNSRHSEPKRAMISNVISVHRKTVAGTEYTIKFNIAESVCDNSIENRGATISKCPITIKPEVEECEIQIVHQAWNTPPYKLSSSISCKLKANPVYYKGKMLNSKILKSKHVDSTMNQNDVLKPLYGGDDHDTVSWGAFTEYMNNFNKNYATREEMERRFPIFQKNILKAKKLTEEDQGTAVYGATEFSDMSEEEFSKYYKTPKWDTSYDPSLKPAEIPTDPAPASFDWRDHKAVTEVKNQGMCGSCWAFSTTGNIEGQWAIKKGQLLSLSEQELVDCDKLDEGCDGGLPSNAYKEIRRLGGLETEKKYPYDGEDEKCAFKVSDSRVYINGSLNITQDEDQMAQWLAKNGPISIGINANMMQFYFGGVSHPFKFLCNPDSLDHGVLIVGYGTKKGFFCTSPYWIVKNSWGPSWGEKGYYLVYRGDGTCGLNQMCTSAEIK